MKKSPRFLVVTGASAGGLNALTEMVHNLPTGLDIAYCIVLHLSRKGIGDFIVHRLQQITSLTCTLAVNNESLKADHIYIARPDQHLLLRDSHIILGSGPEENRFRPSIDVLFRSAAVAFNNHCIGVILSGFLNDGTSGMWAIKRCGGMSIVQDPNEAEYPDMPLSVLGNMDVDHVAPLNEIGNLIETIIRDHIDEVVEIPDEVRVESQIAETTAIGIEAVEKLGNTSVFSCPDCGGNLWTIDSDVIKRYRCHIGHAYTQSDLLIKQSEIASSTLWIAIRMMEERRHLLKKMYLGYEEKGFKSLASSSLKQHADLELHISRLMKILLDVQNHNNS